MTQFIEDRGTGMGTGKWAQNATVDYTEPGPESNPHQFNIQVSHQTSKVSLCSDSENSLRAGPQGGDLGGALQGRADRLLRGVLNRHLRGGSIPTFEEQLALDQEKQRQLDLQQTRMIQNVQFAKASHMRRKPWPAGARSGGHRSPPTSSVFLNQNRGSHSQTVSIQNDSRAVSHTDLRYTTKQQTKSSLLSNGERVTRFETAANTSSTGLVQRLPNHTRQPDFSLEYSASGQLLPKRQAQSKVAMHVFNIEDQQDSFVDHHSRVQKKDGRHERYKSVDGYGKSQVIPPSFLQRRQSSKDYTRGLAIKANLLHKQSMAQTKSTHRNQSVDLIREGGKVKNVTSITSSFDMLSLNKDYRSIIGQSQTALKTMGHNSDYDTTQADQQQTGDLSLPQIQIGSLKNLNPRLPRPQGGLLRDLNLEAGQLTMKVPLHEKKTSILKENSKRSSDTLRVQQKRGVRIAATQQSIETLQANLPSTSELQDPTETEVSLLATGRGMLINETSYREMPDQEDGSDKQIVDEALQGATSASAFSQSGLSSFQKAPAQADASQGGVEMTDTSTRTKLIQGPGHKKFKVLAQLARAELERQFVKQLSQKGNKPLKAKLLKELRQKILLKEQEISQGLKPVRFNDGRNTYESSAKAATDLQGLTKTEFDFQTSSDGSLPADHESSDYDDTSSNGSLYKGHPDGGVFNKTKAHNIKVQKKANRGRESQAYLSKKTIEQKQAQKNPILPKGMTKKTLYDDALFDKWFNDYLRKPPPNQQKLIRRQMIKNQKIARRKRDQRLGAQKESQDRNSEGFTSESESVHLTEGSSSSSEEGSANFIKLDSKEALARKEEQKQKELMSKAIDEPFGLQRLYSDEELRDPKNVQNLIKQVQKPEEDFTLKLSKQVKQILDFFHVTIEGTQDKRRAKRIRLTNYFMMKFAQFIKIEREWAFDIQSADSLIPDKDRYEAKLRRKENDLLKEIRLLGNESIEALRKRHQQKLLYKLIDREEELVQAELLEAKGIALQELLKPAGPSKQAQDFMAQNQPSQELEEVKLEPDPRDSMSPQRRFVASQFGKALIAQLNKSQLAKEHIVQSLARRMAVSGSDGNLVTLGMIRANQVMQKLKATMALVGATPFSLGPSQHAKASISAIESINQNLKNHQSSQSVVTNFLSKQEKDEEKKRKIAINEDMEVFEKSKLTQDYFDSLRVEKPHENDRDAQINNEYSNFCIKSEHVHDLPVFARIKQNELALTSYRLNAGICKGLGAYLAQSNWRIDKQFILKSLVLDNNDMKDEDLAEILAGVGVQGQLQQLSLSRNQFGVEAVTQFGRLLELQSVQGTEPFLQLSRVSLIKVKTSPDVLTAMFQLCLPQMKNLTQLKVQGIPLGSPDITDDLMNGLQSHTGRLELLDLKDTQLTGPQLLSIVTQLMEFKVIHSLDLSENSCRGPKGDQIATQIAEIIAQESKLNHLNLSQMGLGFKQCQAIVQAASTSLSLCALHLSGNSLMTQQQQFLCRTLSIRESELTVESSAQLGIEEIKQAIDFKEKKFLSSDSPRASSNRRTKYKSNRLNAMQDKTLGQIATGPNLKRDLHTYMQHDLAHPVPKIVNAVAAKQNASNIAKMLSLQDGQSSAPIANRNLVFQRQVYTPELLFNQDANKSKDVQIDYSSPFTWHVNVQSDGCYICQQWRYCVLFFSRKTAVQSDFFQQVMAPDQVIRLNKLCGFTQAAQAKERGLQETPWLMGTFTALNRSQLAPVTDYTNLLAYRLTKTVSKVSKSKLKQQVTNKIARFFKAGAASGLGSMLGGEGQKQGAAGQGGEDQFDDECSPNLKVPRASTMKKKSILLPQATQMKLSEKLRNSKQDINDGDESSDFSVDGHTPIFELIQKLRKSDPEALILNYESQENEGDFGEQVSSSDDGLIEDLDAPPSLFPGDKRKQYFAFAAYVPPGKHLVLVRDVNNQHYRVHDSQQPSMVGKQYLSSQVSSINSPHTDHTLIDKNLSGVVTRDSGKFFGGNSLNVNHLRSSQQSDSRSLAHEASIKRLDQVTDVRSNYFYRELLVEPRADAILKTRSEPFQLEQLPKKAKYSTRSLADREEKSQDVQPVTQGVFRDWTEESQAAKQESFIAIVEKPLLNELRAPLNHQQSRESTPDSSPVGNTILSANHQYFAPKKPVPPPEPLFACLHSQTQQLIQILCGSFPLLREFYYELATQDGYNYPRVSMTAFTDLCFTKGEGYLKAIEDPNPPQAVKPASKTSSRDPKRGSRRSKSAFEYELVEQATRAKELYTNDLNRTVRQALLARNSRVLGPGETRQSLNDTLVVDFTGFVAHLIKIAIIWSRGTESGLSSVPQILEAIISKDIGKLRQQVAIESKMLQQMFSNVSLPFDLELFAPNSLTTPPVPLLAHEFRQSSLISQSSISRVLQTYQKSLISVFLAIADQSTSTFDFDSCPLYLKALPLSAFRVPKNKPIRPPTLLKLVKSAIHAESQSEGTPSINATSVLPLRTVQLCFAKSKMLHTQTEIRQGREPPIMQSTHKASKLGDFLPGLQINENTPESETLTVLNLNRVDMRRLSFIEWQEYMCRLAASTFVIDSKTALKTKNATMLRLIETGKRPIAEQVASFLSVALQQLLLQCYKSLLQGKVAQVMGMRKEKATDELEQIFAAVPDLDEVLAQLQ